jgi:hypothetical protein
MADNTVAGHFSCTAGTSNTPGTQRCYWPWYLHCKNEWITIT